MFPAPNSIPKFSLARALQDGNSLPSQVYRRGPQRISTKLFIAFLLIAAVYLYLLGLVGRQ